MLNSVNGASVAMLFCFFFSLDAECDFGDDEDDDFILARGL